MGQPGALEENSRDQVSASGVIGTSSADKSSHPPVQAAWLPWMVAASAIILWVFAMVAAYFWAHKPFDIGMLAAQGQTLLNVTVWLGIIWVASGAGRRLLGALLADEAPAVRLALAAGLGLGLLSLGVLGLGLAGLPRPGIAWALILALGALLRHDLRASAADLHTVLKDAASLLMRPRSGFQRWLAVYIVASLAVAFLMALAPPTAWDALVYHLTGPRLFIEAGRVSHPIDLPYLGFPQLIEMQFTLGMLLSGDGVASLLHFGYGLLALAVTAALARRAFGGEAAWLAAALLLSVPSLLSLMSWAYVEAGLLFYVTAAVYAFIRWRETHAGQSVRWLWLMGMFCGFSTGVKYTAIALPVALGLSVLWVSRRDALRTAAGRLAQFAGFGLIVALPWLLENWLTTGNPVYPFFFPGVYWDAWRAWWYDRPGTGLATSAPWRLLTAPLEATVLGTEGGDPYDATVGPLLLAAAPLLAVVWRALNREERSVAGHLLFFLGLNYALWLAGLARSALLVQTRLLLPIFGVVAVLGAVALDRLAILRRPQLAVDWLARAVMSLTLALLLFSTLVAFLRANPMPVALGIEPRDAYLARHLGVYQLAINEINTLPPGSQVVFLWEPRSYACRVDCQPDALLDRFLHLTSVHPDAHSIAQMWRDEGVTHVLLYEQGLQMIVEDEFDPVTPRDLAILAELQTWHMEEVFRLGDAYVLYRVRPEPDQ